MAQERTDGAESTPHTPARRRVLRGAAWVATVLVLLCAGGIGFLYVKFNGNLRGIDINAALGSNRPANIDNGSMDILVLGSDSRSGANKKAGGGTDNGTARSDTAMIVHIYRGHRRASIVSIPRDTLVSRPMCVKADGRVVPAATGVMFNEAYAIGGPACAVKTVETMTGVRMDHYVEVDFSGFQHLVDALGGVPVTTTRAIDDNDSHLHLAAGTHTLNGKQALGLVRTRHGVGDGSDLGRIRLQQAFIKALVDRIDGIGLLTSPTRLYDIANTATSAITTDTDLASVQSLVGFGQSLKGLQSKRIAMVTMPVQYDVNNPNRVVPIESKDALVWSALREDRAIPASATQGSAANRVSTAEVVRSAG